MNNRIISVTHLYSVALRSPRSNTGIPLESAQNTFKLARLLDDLAVGGARTVLLSRRRRFRASQNAPRARRERETVPSHPRSRCLSEFSLGRAVSACRRLERSRSLLGRLRLVALEEAAQCRHPRGSRPRDRGLAGIPRVPAVSLRQLGNSDHGGQSVHAGDRRRADRRVELRRADGSDEKLLLEVRMEGRCDVGKRKTWISSDCSARSCWSSEVCTRCIRRCRFRWMQGRFRVWR